MIYWEPFEYNDRIYQLDHLHPFEMDVVQAAKGKNAERKYPFFISFSLHCFSRKKLRNEEDINLYYSDSRETRVFCYNRYELSKRLPDIIRDIGRKKCSHTGHGNFFIVEIMTEEGKSQNYEVYFSVRKEKKGKLWLHIESAYIRDRNHAVSRKKKPIAFYVIAHNKLHNKLIKIPK